MTREDIILMADASGLSLYGMGKDREQFIDYLEKFAALVASAERERIKQANAPEIERINAHLKELEDAVKTEREACAKVAQDDSDWNGDVATIANLIRERL